jgi:hypothetical protein
MFVSSRSSSEIKVSASSAAPASVTVTMNSRGSQLDEQPADDNSAARISTRTTDALAQFGLVVRLRRIQCASRAPIAGGFGRVAPSRSVVGALVLGGIEYAVSPLPIKLVAVDMFVCRTNVQGGVTVFNGT